MIEITTADFKGDEFESTTHINGSAEEIIRDFFSLYDTINKSLELKLLYVIAIKKWESEHENN